MASKNKSLDKEIVVKTSNKLKPTAELFESAAYSQSQISPSDVLPPELFDYVMSFACQDLETLQNCRLVCKDFNKKISRSLYESPSKKWGAIIERRFEESLERALPSEEKLDKLDNLVNRGILPSDVIERLAQKLKRSFEEEEDWLIDITLINLKCAASLAYRGLLGPLEEVKMCGDLTSIPPEHLVSLVSSVTWSVKIENVSACDLVTILDSVRNCEEIVIAYQSLSREETEALVRVMESHVKEACLEGATVDAEALLNYSGHGRCQTVACIDEAAAKYREELRSWASNKGWNVAFDDETLFMIIN